MIFVYNLLYLFIRIEKLIFVSERNFGLPLGKRHGLLATVSNARRSAVDGGEGEGV